MTSIKWSLPNSCINFIIIIICPLYFKIDSQKLKKIHAYVTRGSNKSNYFLSRVSKTVGQNKLKYRGVKLWNQISEKLKCKSFNLFKKLYKEFLLNVHSFK